MYRFPVWSAGPCARRTVGTQYVDVEGRSQASRAPTSFHRQSFFTLLPYSPTTSSPLYSVPHPAICIFIHPPGPASALPRRALPSPSVVVCLLRQPRPSKSIEEAERPSPSADAQHPRPIHIRSTLQTGRTTHHSPLTIHHSHARTHKPPPPPWPCPAAAAATVLSCPSRPVLSRCPR